MLICGNSVATMVGALMYHKCLSVYDLVLVLICIYVFSLEVACCIFLPIFYKLMYLILGTSGCCAWDASSCFKKSFKQGISFVLAGYCMFLSLFSVQSLWGEF